MTQTRDRVHYNLDVHFVTFAELPDAKQAAIIKAVTDTLDRFHHVDFVDTVTVGEL